MPANNLIRPDAEHTGEVNRQCTCPSPLGGGFPHCDDLDMATMQLDTDSSTCALHPSSMAVRKQQAKQRQFEHLQRHQEQLLRRKPDPFEAVRVLPSKTFHLYTGSRFQGKQRSGSHSYDVVVDIKVLFASVLLLLQIFTCTHEWDMFLHTRRFSRRSSCCERLRHSFPIWRLWTWSCHCFLSNILSSLLLLLLMHIACRSGRFVSVRIPPYQGIDRGVPRVDDILWGRDHRAQTLFLYPQMGCRWVSWRRALGKHGALTTYRRLFFSMLWLDCAVLFVCIFCIEYLPLLFTLINVFFKTVVDSVQTVWVSVELSVLWTGQACGQGRGSSVKVYLSPPLWLADVWTQERGCRVYAVEGALSGTGPPSAGYLRSQLCRILLHLLQQVDGTYQRLLLSPLERKVSDYVLCVATGVCWIQMQVLLEAM